MKRATRRVYATAAVLLMGWGTAYAEAPKTKMATPIPDLDRHAGERRHQDWQAEFF
ncbi:hypothetical protein [Rhizobium laguerreae]|uniref:hypothetical protein n=1 Tax=Rhizobium laguerreae TaxID=1076926 RepID=UPI003008D6BA